MPVGESAHARVGCSSASPLMRTRADEQPVDVARIGVLLTVPLAWGTYAPAVKVAFAAASEPAVPGIALCAVQYLFAALALTAAGRFAGGGSGARLRGAARSSSRGVWAAALELGGMLFLANVLHVAALARLPTDRAAFLVQSSTILVPLMLAAQRGGFKGVPARTWTACVLAASGVLAMSAGSPPSATLGAPSAGDGLALCAALIYALHVLRLSVLAPSHGPLRLATRKATCELLLASALLSALLVVPALPAGAELRAFAAQLSAMRAPELALLAAAGAWMGAVTTGYTMWAQAYGQGGRVSAPVASLIYSSGPLWSAAFALALLGEKPRPEEAVGGALIVAALVVGAFAHAGRPSGALALRRGIGRGTARMKRARRFPVSAAGTHRRCWPFRARRRRFFWSS
ncbi:hypothetical protein KFE25_010149 [Diacronema lutheri]|uniref:EamA domain-containing protein n=1 Tax=Diacronema lutheri TaxID=2081491 RepID=A0A8J6CB57_DIALT|nr:hypothetical protein KFE25_010149 [Diacronema lutheri]